jgi:glyoxylase-like metal-dependent hydrolase (beta-lactamase superfamily II)
LFFVALFEDGIMIARLVGIIAFACLFAFTVHAQEAKRSITKVAGDVYRFQNNFHFSLVVVTNAGVVVVDPISESAAQWLRDNLKTITDKPVTHLVYSHSDLDHASGGKTYSGAQVIAHANAPNSIDGVVPDKRFDDKMTLAVGGKSLELTWLGEGHAKDLIAVVIRPENVEFIVDVASVRGLPFRDFPHSNVDGWIDQLHKVATLDFDIFAGGHGRIGIKEDADAVRIYMEKMRKQVLAGLNAGKSVDDMVTTVTMDDYKDWGQYKAWRGLNIQGMARFLRESGQVK